MDDLVGCSIGDDSIREMAQLNQLAALAQWCRMKLQHLELQSQIHPREYPREREQAQAQAQAQERGREQQGSGSSKASSTSTKDHLVALEIIAHLGKAEAQTHTETQTQTQTQDAKFTWRRWESDALVGNSEIFQAARSLGELIVEENFSEFFSQGMNLLSLLQGSSSSSSGRDFLTMHDALSCTVTNVRARRMVVISKAFSRVSVKHASEQVGLSTESMIREADRLGWEIENRSGGGNPEAMMIQPKRISRYETQEQGQVRASAGSSIQDLHSVGMRQLDQLTDYVSFLEKKVGVKVGKGVQ